MRPAAFVDFRCISLDPAPDTTGIHWDAAFGHQLGHVFISQGVLEVPTDALHDHLTGKMAAFEGIGGCDRHAPPRYQTPPPNFATAPSRRHGLLYGRGADLAWTGDVLCPIFHSPGQPEGLPCWHHRSSGGVLDASDSLQCNI